MDVGALLASLPIGWAILTDQEGVVLLRLGDGGQLPDMEVQRMAATFAQTAEHSGKLRMGRSQHAVAFYGRCSISGMIHVSSSSVRLTHCHESTLCADKAIVLHICCTPLILTVVCNCDANIGMILDAAPQLRNVIEPLRHVAEQHHAARGFA